jgi:maintenance of morphology protein 1
MTLQTPPPTSSPPVLTLSISPNFILELTTTSLMGSRAKLANVPKLHELIQHQARRILAARGTWRVVLPGLANLADVKTELSGETKASS